MSGSIKALILATGLVAMPLAAETMPVKSRAIADLVDAQGQTKGHAVLEQGKDGIHVMVRGLGLPAGVRAVHIHTTGICTGPDFKSAGGHWNPTMKQHGHDNPAGQHMGDLLNITIVADGTGTLEAVIPGATLTGGDNPLLDADGAAVVIHADGDDYKTDPTGNAGGRIACGVVKG